jgi:hypothetical protein
MGKRYVVQLLSKDRPLPDSRRRRFQSFLEKLPLVAFEVRAVKIEGNDITDLE